jgi:2-dehydro-3-deoxyphosphooctonate aldolase (KDO 8-P synthase)
MEVHDNPAMAKSDGANAMNFGNLGATLRELLAIRSAVSST